MTISQAIKPLTRDPISGFNVVIGEDEDGNPAVQIVLDRPSQDIVAQCDDPWLLDMLAIDILDARRQLISRREQKERTARNVAALTAD